MSYEHTTMWVALLIFFWHFSQTVDFACLFYVPVYTELQIFIQLFATLTKLCHIKRDHHNVLEMSTIVWNAHWVVALNVA